MFINQALEDQDNVSKSPPSRARTKKSIPNTRPNTRPSTRVRSPEKVPQSKDRPSTSKHSKSVEDQHSSSSSAKNAGESGENTSKSPAERDDKRADDSNRISGDGIGGKADGGSANGIEIIIDDDASESQADSGLSSDGMLVDENDNDVYNNGNESDDDDDDYDDDFDSDFDYSSDEDTEDILKQNTTKLERSLFGVHIRELGESF